MANLSITPANVLFVSGRRKTVLAGATITAGHWLYFDASARKWKLAQADGTAAEAGEGGLAMALCGGGDGQQIQVALPGSIVDLGSASLTKAARYELSATAGALAAQGDVITSGQYVGPMAIALDTHQLRLLGHYPGVALP